MALNLEKSARFCLILVLLAALTACGSRHHGPAVAQRGFYKVGNPYTIDGVTYVPTEEFRHTETGVASWYGPGFHGKSTANGEVYDQSDHTAAHRTLQMPCVLRVTNLDNGQSTIVRVNDRGPYARSRILDVSRAAAEELGMVGRGTARIRIDQLEAESLAMKQIALNGGGPDEQRAALDQYIAGNRPPPPVVAAPQPPPPAPAPPPPPPTPPVTVYPSPPPSLPSEPPPPPPRQGPPTVASIASAATAATCSRAADSMSRPAPSRAWAMPRSSAACHQLRLDRDFPGVLGRPRGVSCAPGSLFDAGGRRHCRRPAQAFRLW